MGRRATSRAIRTRTCPRVCVLRADGTRHADGARVGDAQQTRRGHARSSTHVCVHTRDRRHTDRQQQHRRQRRWRHGGGGIVLGCCPAPVAATELRWCSLRLPAAPAALPLRCLCLCLWLRLWATAAAAPLPVEDREEEAPRAHLRAGTQPARGSNPGRAVRESSSDARRRRRKFCTKT